MIVMTDDPDHGDRQVGNTDPRLPIVTFDTSVISCLVLDLMGVEQDIRFSISKVRKFMEGKRKAILKEVSREVGDRITDMLSKRGEETGRVIDVTEILKEDGFEWISNSECRDYKQYYEAIKERMQWMVSNPNSAVSTRWLKLKWTWLRNKKIVRENTDYAMSGGMKRKTLRYLKKKAGRDDMRMLAKVMKISETGMVYFLSNDGDHIALREWANGKTNGRLRIERPPLTTT